MVGTCEVADLRPSADDGSERRWTADGCDLQEARRTASMLRGENVFGARAVQSQPARRAEKAERLVARPVEISAEALHDKYKDAGSGETTLPLLFLAAGCGGRSRRPTGGHPPTLAYPCCYHHKIRLSVCLHVMYAQYHVLP